MKTQDVTEKYSQPDLATCRTAPVTPHLLGCLANNTGCIHAITEQARVLCLHPEGDRFRNEQRPPR